MDTRELVEQYKEEMIAERRMLHQNPELSGNEFETSKLVRERLAACGIEVAEIGMKTGVVGVLRGTKPGKNLAIRADMDALPMQELSGLPFASKNAGVCHSCGHDIHTAVLLCCAKALSAIKDELEGNVLFLFQPAEEIGQGAKELIRCNFTQVLKPDTIISLHTAPAVDAGYIRVGRGPSGASADSFRIVVTGKGGHGAHPENFIDPITASGYILTQLQTIVARENHPLQAAVVTIGSIHGGNAANVVPDKVEMTGTLRSLNEENRWRMQKSIDRIVEHCCEAMRASGEVIWSYGVPAGFSDSKVVDDLEKAAGKVIGCDHVLQSENPSLGSEDFSCLTPAYGPGTQFGLGTGNEDPNSRLGLHSAKILFDERSMEVGASVLIQYARDFLKNDAGIK